MRKISNILVIYISVTALIFGHTMPAYAGLVGTDQFLAQQVTNQNREAIFEIFERSDAQELLEKNGVSNKQAHERIAALTDEEVRMLTKNFDDLPAGGIGNAAAILILVLLIIVLALGN